MPACRVHSTLIRAATGGQAVIGSAFVHSWRKTAIKKPSPITAISRVQTASNTLRIYACISSHPSERRL
jgi:hypothetical protein